MEEQPNESNSLDSLEDPGTVVESTPTTSSSPTPPPENSPSAGGSSPQPEQPEARSTLRSRLSRRVQALASHFNIYFLLFIFIFLLAIIFVYVGLQKTKQQTAQSDVSTQFLTADTLQKLKDTQATVGDPKQTLTIESNAIFSGKILVRDSLDVAGTIKVGGSLNLPGITVSGTSSFNEIQANNLSIAGNTSIQGQLNIQKNLTVTGSASFGGAISAPQLNIQTLQLSNDLQLNRHIDAGGSTPSKSDSSALGGGGTSSISGTDTAGTVTINTGSNPPAGCFINITFAQKFNGTPHVVITPVGSGAAGLNYYINRNGSGFSICTTNSAPAGTSFSFDYMAID